MMNRMFEDTPPDGSHTSKGEEAEQEGNVHPMGLIGKKPRWGGSGVDWYNVTKTGEADAEDHSPQKGILQYLFCMSMHRIKTVFLKMGH